MSGERRLSSPSFRREWVAHGTRDSRVRRQHSLPGRSNKLRGFFGPKERGPQNDTGPAGT